MNRKGNQTSLNNSPNYQQQKPLKNIFLESNKIMNKNDNLNRNKR